MQRAGEDEVSTLKRRLARMERVNRALLSRAQSGAQQPSLLAGGAFVDRVRARTSSPEQLQRRLVQTERSLAAARRGAAQASRAKGAFLATMSHELRTPLNGMIGMLQVALSSEALPASVRDDLETVLKSSDNLQHLLDDILDFAKIESGKLRVDPEPFDLWQCVGDVAELFAEAIQSKGVELLLDIDPATPRGVVGDPSRLRQILTNLLSNATKFTDIGAIAVRVEPVVGEPGMLRFEVRDTGAGIPADNVEDLFQPFMQTDSTMARAHGGSGLGLAICRQLCTLLGGSIWVNSREGQGTTIWFTVRMANGKVDAPLASGELSGRTVVIAERCPEVARIGEQILRGEGMDVRVVTSGRDALDLVRSLTASGATPDFLLLDFGLEDSEALQVAADLPTTATVLLTPWALRGIVDTERPRGVRATVARPLRRDALVQALLRAMGQPVGTPAASIAPLSRRDARILVAEDNPINQKVAVRCLGLLGLDADVVDSGSAALAALARQPYDLVLMDWMMPGMDGCEATREFRASEPKGSRVPIVAMTANAMEGDRETCLRAGMDDYLAKPVRLAQLRQVIDHWLAGSRPDSAC